MNKGVPWKHRWYGVWREYGPAYLHCPSVQDFVDSEFWRQRDREAVANYLGRAHVISTTSRLSFPCAVSGKRYPGALSYRTDGDWLWLDDLEHYVLEHDVAIPLEMLEALSKNHYVPPSVSDEALKYLDWPPIGGAV